MRIHSRFSAAVAGAALTLGLAACGSSKAPGVVQAPSAGLTQEASTTPTATTPTTSTPTTSTAASTPVPPQLSKKPVVVVPKGPAPTHLVTTDIIKGTGATAAPGKTIVVNYVGTLYKTGKQFDASWDRNQPFSTALANGSVIPGWVQGIAGMKVGGRRELIIPPALAYGSSGQGTIPPNSTLVFVVDLLSVS
ncbi:MAG: FKBP-type peptidyl-prolyl cis-trans isomerase [Kineosporiaceae bacterium]